MFTKVATWKDLHKRIVRENKVLECHRKDVQKGCDDIALNSATTKALLKGLSVERSKEALQRLDSIKNGTFPNFIFHSEKKKQPSRQNAL